MGERLGQMEVMKFDERLYRLARWARVWARWGL
jgi:hypothetical protein